MIARAFTLALFLLGELLTQLALERFSGQGMRQCRGSRGRGHIGHREKPPTYVNFTVKCMRRCRAWWNDVERVRKVGGIAVNGRPRSVERRIYLQ